MPFAVGSFLVASEGRFSLTTFGLVLLSMIFARSAAMTFNRLADWEIDKRNPRTVGRHKLVSRPEAIALLVVSSLLFIGTTWFINFLCFLLSPVALAIVFFYSLTKRFTSYAQLFLGLALSVSPVGAWLAVRGEFALAPLILALGVLLWVAGFDLIYATQDYAIDRKEGLKSMVVLLGISGALRAARLLHVSAWGLFGLFGWVSSRGFPYWIGMVVIAPVLIWEHRVASKPDVEAVNKAFFLANAIVGAVFVAAVAIDCLV